MDNLSLPEIDFSKPPEFNTQVMSSWSLKNDRNHECVSFESRFSQDEVADIMKLGRSFSLNKSKTSDGVEFSNVRKSYNSWIPPCSVTESLYTKIGEIINHANDVYFNFDLVSLEHLQFTEYDDNYQGKYDMHVDRFINPGYSGAHRKLSFSIQLSDPQMYEGGDLVLYTGRDPISAIKTVGSITLFPSYTLHQVTPVTKGCRYSLVGWAAGPRFR